MEAIVDIVRLDNEPLCTRQPYNTGRINFAILSKSEQEIQLDIDEEQHFLADENVKSVVVEPLDRKIVLKPGEGIAATAYFTVETDNCRNSKKKQLNKGALIDLTFKIFKPMNAYELAKGYGSPGDFSSLVAARETIKIPIILPSKCIPCCSVLVRLSFYFPAKSILETLDEHAGNCYLDDRSYLCDERSYCEGNHHNLYCHAFTTD